MTNTPKIAAIITIYEPPESLGQLLEAVQSQVDEVIFIDNGENTPLKGAHWLSNPENGLAKAQNMGIDKAKDLKCSYILLLDDDSVPEENMVKKLLKAAKSHKNAAIIGPYLQEEALGQEPKYIQGDGDYFFKRVEFDEHTPVLENLYYVAASGSLIPIEIFDHIGEMKEEFFIYFVDTEFCLRARKAGFDVIAVRDAKLNHRFGKRSNHKVLGASVSTTNHSAKARGYMFRNRRHLWIKYFDSDAGYVLFDILRAQSEWVRVLMFEKDKMAKLSAMAHGLLKSA
ncbi:MAG: glycosyltransferase [Rickettsiales bacterium]|nr:glycosyltransferase [Rickettsiales bacterium]